MTPLKLAQGMSDGHAAHVAWEAVRGSENEIDAERRLAEEAEASGAQMKEWWDGWLYRSDLWRDEIGHESDNTEAKGPRSGPA